MLLLTDSFIIRDLDIFHLISFLVTEFTNNIHNAEEIKENENEEDNFKFLEAKHISYYDLKESVEFKLKFDSKENFHQYMKCCFSTIPTKHVALIVCNNLDETCKFCLRNYLQLKHGNEKYNMLFDKNICPLCSEESVVTETHDILRNVFGADYINGLMESPTPGLENDQN